MPFIDFFLEYTCIHDQIQKHFILRFNIVNDTCQSPHV